MSELVRNKLISMSRNLGDPVMDYAILGEGNTSARIDADTFWIKASGTSLRTLKPDDLVQVYFQTVFDLLSNDVLSDEDILAGLKSARVDPEVDAVPSVETFLHAIILQLNGVNFVGHTHPTAINTILCSEKAAEAYSGSLFPDQIVYCGPRALFIPYTDPGLVLAKKIHQEINNFVDTTGEIPKVILMQNHGFIALGNSAEDVENITQMSVKAARVIAGTYALGGPHFLTSESVNRIHTRPDERYRKKLWRTT